MKKLLQQLSNYEGNGTSLISLIIPSGDQLAKYSTLLTTEYGAASNIKSRTNRLAVLSAITSTQQKIKTFNKVPPNGLAIFCGIVMVDGKEKKLTIDMEPYKPVTRSLYMCDKTFHLEILEELMETNENYGFVIIDGEQTHCYILNGANKTFLGKIYGHIPNKHNKGGQSAPRFGRIRDEEIHSYIKKICEFIKQCFVERNDLSGLVLAGPAELKNNVSKSETLDYRLKDKIISIVDTSYGGRTGLNNAILLSADAMNNMSISKERILVENFMKEIAKDSSKYCFGIQDTMYCLELGAVNELIIWEDLELLRVVTKEKVEYTFDCTQLDSEILQIDTFTDWIAENYKDYGTNLHFISDKSQEGSQFCKGFGGIGGILRYAVEMTSNFEDSDSDSEW